MLHKNIPIFIPHLGCPNQCVFCNQRSISGCRGFDEAQVPMQIEQALSTLPREGAEVEIAFFGGSFTGIERSLMLRLLELAQSYVDQGKVHSIRLSTRPDYISGEILDILAGYSVKHIELGLQSMDDGVLRTCLRGHTVKQAEAACLAVVKAGFSLTGQMMIGLPGSTLEKELDTARRICSLGATSARIYPTVVFRGTRLCDMTEGREYQPLTVEEAVVRSAAVLRIFEAAGVPCIRIGLCASEDLISPEQVMAGPNHPALGELIWNEYYYQRLKETAISQALLGECVNLLIEERLMSKIVGQRRCNLLRLSQELNITVNRVIGEKETAGFAFAPCEGSRKT